MTITLSPNQEEAILAAIRAGQVGSVEEVIDRAIAGLAARAETQATPVAGSPHGTLHEFFMNSPLRGANLNLERAEDYPRTVDLG